MTPFEIYFVLLAGTHWALALDPTVCDRNSLELVHCPFAEHGFDWAAFLAEVCSVCPVGRPCTLETASQAIALATEVVNSGTVLYRCIAGVMSALIVLSQFYVMSSPNAEYEELFKKSLNLWPFPFHSSQYSLYMNMVPVRITMCNHGVDVDFGNIFVPKARLDSNFCGMSYSDEVLIRRCRSRRNNGRSHLAANVASKRASDLRRVNCPAAPVYIGDERDQEFERKTKKYTERAESFSCSTHKGMWREEMSAVHKCVLVSVGHLLNFRPGDLVLDWGSGCGHKLSWAKMLFDVEGLGVDIEGTAVAWARHHSAGTFCHADGRDLRWIPDGTFDHVISYAAIYHLPPIEQCHVGLQLVSKLRVGGRAYIGWNRGDVMSSWEWIACFRAAQDGWLPQDETESDKLEIGLDSGGRLRPSLAGALQAIAAGMEVNVEAVEDGFLFPPDVSTVQSNGSFLFQFPAYSLLLTRAA